MVCTVYKHQPLKKRCVLNAIIVTQVETAGPVKVRAVCVTLLLLGLSHWWKLP